MWDRRERHRRAEYHQLARVQVGRRHGEGEAQLVEAPRRHQSRDQVAQAVRLDHVVGEDALQDGDEIERRHVTPGHAAQSGDQGVVGDAGRDRRPDHSAERRRDDVHQLVPGFHERPPGADVGEAFSAAT